MRLLLRTHSLKRAPSKAYGSDADRCDSINGITFFEMNSRRKQSPFECGGNTSCGPTKYFVNAIFSSRAIEQQIDEIILSQAFEKASESFDTYYTPSKCRQHSHYWPQRHFAPHRHACTTTRTPKMPFLSKEDPFVRGRFVPHGCNRYRLDLAHADARSMPTLRCGMGPTIHRSKCVFTSRTVAPNPLAPPYKLHVGRIRSPCATLVTSSSH